MKIGDKVEIIRDGYKGKIGVVTEFVSESYVIVRIEINGKHDIVYLRPEKVRIIPD